MSIKSNLKPIAGSVFGAVLILLLPAGAYGQHNEGQGHGGGQESEVHGGDHGSGEAGIASEVSRTIEISMIDTRFTPERLSVEVGETIRFVVTNNGALIHEFNIGTAQMHAMHQREMMMMVQHGVLELDKINHARMTTEAMQHSDPNSVLLEPGQSAEIVWKFSEAGELEFACNVPGHYQSGMVGDISFR